MLVRWHADGPDSQVFKDHVSRIPDYLWYVTILHMHNISEINSDVIYVYFVLLQDWS